MMARTSFGHLRFFSAASRRRPRGEAVRGEALAVQGPPVWYEMGEEEEEGGGEVGGGEGIKELFLDECCRSACILAVGGLGPSCCWKIQVFPWYAAFSSLLLLSSGLCRSSNCESSSSERHV